MLLFLVTLGVGLIFLTIGIIGGFNSNWDSDLSCYITSIGIFSILVMLVMLIGIIIHHNTAIGDTLKLQQEYESLYYQASHHMYNNDNEVGKKELMNQIQDYNSGLVARRYYSKSPWFNWFYSIDYDQFKEIPYDLVE